MTVFVVLWWPRSDEAYPSAVFVSERKALAFIAAQDNPDEYGVCESTLNDARPEFNAARVRTMLEVQP